MIEHHYGRLEGKVALITGGGSGLGEAMAKLFVKEGAKVVITDINDEGANRVKSEIGEGAIALHQNVVEEERWKEVVKETVDTFGALHILVNNAGIGATNSIDKVSFEKWKLCHSVNLDAVFLGCKYALDAIAESGGGSIINISSIAGVIAAHNGSSYNSAKAGVTHLSKSVALHCAKQHLNIRCNSIHPTFTETPIMNAYKKKFGEKEAMAKFARQIPLGRVGQPNDIAYGALYLASDESSFVTGTELRIDGGISAM